MKILAFETSCDETAVAVLDDQREILSNVLHSQVQIHKPYGGIVPELASRSHIEQIQHLTQEALRQAETNMEEINAIAATRGPGLLGALLVGMNYAQALAKARNLPFIPVNHLHGHLISADLDNPMKFPALVLLVTGGHTALYLMQDEIQATLILKTVDDAVGEAFDKTAKLMGLPYPGGPAIEQEAKHGNAARFSLPIPNPKDSRALSLSGLKTAVRRELEQLQPDDAAGIRDLCASFQETVARYLTTVLQRGLKKFPETSAIYLVGGVARNQKISEDLQQFARQMDLDLVAPSPQWCTDNAAMIARAARANLDHATAPGQFDTFDLQPQNRWEYGFWPE